MYSGFINKEVANECGRVNNYFRIHGSEKEVPIPRF